jgi:hypothetical protein
MGARDSRRKHGKLCAPTVGALEEKYDVSYENWLQEKYEVRTYMDSPPSSAEVREWVELYLHSPNTPSWRGA